jgi:predicted transcriptional regulator
MLTDLKVDIILMLSDNQGYSNSQLAEKLKKEASNISNPLGELEDEGLIIRERRTNKKDRRRSNFPYYLNKSKSIKIFESIMEKSVKNASRLQNVLSNINFNNFIIANSSLTAYFKVFENFLNNPETIEVISKIVLANELVNEECKRFMENVIASPNDSNRFFTMLKARRLVEILQSFDVLEALNFYKNTIGESFSVIFAKIAAEKGIIHAELLRSFLEYDIALNPFTSYPVADDPILLLFMRPFERIYDDIYLLKESDRDIMIKRAYFIYLNFDKIILSGINSMRTESEGFEAIMEGGEQDEEGYEKLKKDHFIRYLRKDLFYEKKYLNLLIKELIFYWNIASLRLDWIYYALIKMEKTSPGTEKRYHIKSDSNGIQAINLDNDKKIFHKEATREAMMLTALYRGEADPFLSLRFCNCFRDFSFQENQIKFEEIVSEATASLNYD